MNDIISGLKGKLVVSCQAYPGEPMRDPKTMTQIAQACVIGGAAAIRAQGLADCESIVQAVDVPVIGLWKDGHEGVYITPTLDHAIAVADTGCQIVAIDATLRPRPDGRTFAETVAELKAARPGIIVMADCGSVADAVAAEAAGADLIGTTLAGYSGDRVKTDGPDFELIDELAQVITKPLIVEGRIHTVEQARAVMEHGAYMAVVGTAITHPATITAWFKKAVEG